MNAPAPLMAFVLKLPHRPRSAVITKSSAFPPARGARRSSSSGCDAGSTRVARLFNTRSISVANGRACWMRSCARSSLDAATIFIAFVICCVDFTARMRRRISNSDGIYRCLLLMANVECRHLALGIQHLRHGHLLRGREGFPELLERGVQLRLDRVVDRLRRRERLQQLGAARVEELVQ